MEFSDGYDPDAPIVLDVEGDLRMRCDVLFIEKFLAIVCCDNNAYCFHFHLFPMDNQLASSTHILHFCIPNKNQSL